MSSNATIAGTLVSRPFFIVYMNNIISRQMVDTSVDFTRSATINLSCSSPALVGGTDANVLSISNTQVMVNEPLILNSPIYSSPNTSNNFTTALNGVLPIGYSTTYTQTATSFTSGAIVVLSTALSLSGGVWLVNPIQRIVKGTGTFNTSSATAVIITLASGTGTILPTLAAGINRPIPNGALNGTLDFVMGNYTLTITGTTAIIQHSQQTVMTVGTATRQMIITFTKIA